MFRLLFVQRCLCPDYRRTIRVCGPCNFERAIRPFYVHIGLDISIFGLGPQPGSFSHYVFTKVDKKSSFELRSYYYTEVITNNILENLSLRAHLNFA